MDMVGPTTAETALGQRGGVGDMVGDLRMQVLLHKAPTGRYWGRYREK